MFRSKCCYGRPIDEYVSMLHTYCLETDLVTVVRAAAMLCKPYIFSASGKSIMLRLIRKMGIVTVKSMFSTSGGVAFLAGSSCFRLGI